MQSTWLRSPSSRRRAPTARAVCPPMPASTSSNTSVASRRGRVRDAHDREHHARELAARGDLAQRRRRARRGWRDQELDGVAAGRARLALAERDLEAGVAHRQRARAARATAAAQPRRRRARAARSAPRVPLELRARASQALGRLPRRARPRRRPARRGARAQRVACSSTASMLPPCLRISALERREALFDRLEREPAAPARVTSSRPARRSRAARRRGPAASIASARSALGERVERADRRRERVAGARPRRRAAGRAPGASAPPRRGERLGARRGGGRSSASRRRSRSRAASSSLVLALVGCDARRSRRARTRAGRARARARRRARAARSSRALELAHAARAAPRRRAGARLLGAAEAVEDLELGGRRASACGARAGRRRRAARRRGRAGRRPPPSAR